MNTLVSSANSIEKSKSNALEKSLMYNINRSVRVWIPETLHV